MTEVKGQGRGRLEGIHYILVGLSLGMGVTQLPACAHKMFPLLLIEVKYGLSG